MLKVAFLTEGDGAASAWIRAHWVAAELARQQLAETYAAEVIDEHVVRWADVVVFQRCVGRMGSIRWWDLAERLEKAIVYETDDNIFVHPDAPRGPYYTKQELDTGAAMIRRADLVTCGTEGVRAAMAPFNTRTTIIPNAIPAAHLAWPRPQNTGEIRLGFIAAPAHDDDWALIAPAVRSVMASHPAYRMVFQGWLPAGAVGDVPVGRFTHSQNRHLLEMYKVLPGLGIDILLVPWAPDKPFNRGKSVQKWLDATSIGAVCIASPMSDWGILCKHEDTVLLCERPEDWAGAIDRLVRDDALRMALLARSRAVIWERFTCEATAPHWFAVLQSAHNRKER